LRLTLSSFLITWRNNCIKKIRIELLSIGMITCPITYRQRISI